MKYEEVLDVIQGNVDEELLNAFNAESKLILIRARAGAGKTFLSLAYSIYQAIMGKKVALFFRTRSEVNQALRIAYEIRAGLAKKSISAPTVIPIVGKDALCRYPPDNKSVIKWWCRIIDCEYLNHKISSDFRDVVKTKQFGNIRDYFILAREMGLCPYFALQLTAAESSIVATTHPYFIKDELFERLGERDILIVDEAHNLIKPVTARISESEYSFTITVADEVEIQNMILGLWRSNRKGKATRVSRYWSFINSAGEVIRVDGEYIRVVPPNELISERMKSAEKIFILSSTLYPLNLYKKLFAGSNEVETRVYPGFMKSTERRMIVILKIGLTSRYSERGERTYKLYSSVISELVREISKPTIIFVPSKEFAMRLSRELRYDVIMDEKELYRVNSDKVISVMGSRLSEGVDIIMRGGEPRLLIVAGLPYPRRDNEYVEVVKFYARHYRVNAGTLLKTIEVSEMLSRLIQTAGRVGRKSKGAVIIIDDRITRMNLKLPIYISLKNLVRDLNAFFNE